MTQDYQYFDFEPQHQNETLPGRCHRLTSNLHRKLSSQTDNVDESLLALHKHILNFINAIEASKKSSFNEYDLIFKYYEWYLLEFLARLNLLLDEPNNKENIEQLYLLLERLPDSTERNFATFSSTFLCLIGTASTIGIGVIFSMLNPPLAALFALTAVYWLLALSLNALLERINKKPHYDSTSKSLLEMSTWGNLITSAILTSFCIVSSPIFAFTTIFLSAFGVLGGFKGSLHESHVSTTVSSVKTLKTDVEALANKHGLFKPSSLNEEKAYAVTGTFNIEKASEPTSQPPF